MTTRQSQGSTWRHQEEALSARLGVLHRRARDMLAIEPGIEAVNRLLTGDLSGSAAALTTSCVAWSTADEPRTEAQRMQVRELLIDLQDLGSRVFEHEMGLLTQRLADCDSAIAQLRGCTSSQDLLDRVCEELVLRCRFGRAVLSRVDGTLWTPWMAHFSGMEDTWFSDWVDKPIALDGMVVESRILKERRPEAVYDTEAADVYKPIIVDAGHSSSYVVAPVIVADAVIGFLHADYNTTGRRVDVVDRDVLWAFSQGFAQLYERAVLRERLTEQRERMRAALAATDELLEGRGGMTLDSGDSATVARPSVRREIDTGVEQLTDRELEVLALLAEGATNSQIAEELVVAQSTVKTHVKHILRKLGVANRGEAICRYLGA
jgi:DNA-binding CsgD family transcriptional regulator